MDSNFTYLTTCLKEGRAIDTHSIKMLHEMLADKIPESWRDQFYFPRGVGLKKYMSNFQEGTQWITTHEKAYFIDLSKIFDAKSLFNEFVLQRTMEQKEDREKDLQHQKEEKEKKNTKHPDPDDHHSKKAALEEEKNNSQSQEYISIDKNYLSMKLYNKFAEVINTTPEEGFFIGGVKLINCYWNDHTRELVLTKDEDCWETLPAIHVTITNKAVEEFSEKTFNITCYDLCVSGGSSSAENI
jgi:hypothetical protein